MLSGYDRALKFESVKGLRVEHGQCILAVSAG